MPFEWFRRMGVPDVVLVKYRVFPDERGFFAELYKRGDYAGHGIPHGFVQANLSYSRRGVVRGLHYQLKPMEQGKLVTVVRGRVYDVAVDIRRGSPWFGRYVGVVLEPGLALWVPPGFAHGFQALEDSYVLYFVTKEYSPGHERCVSWDDPDLSIDWPVKDVVLSERDKACPPLREAENNFGYPV